MVRDLMKRQNKRHLATTTLETIMNEIWSTI